MARAIYELDEEDTEVDEAPDRFNSGQSVFLATATGDRFVLERPIKLAPHSNEAKVSAAPWLYDNEEMATD